MSEWRLTQNETKLLINLYREKECLWDYKSSIYKRNDLKNKAWTFISQQMDREPGDVKKKIKNLRSAYVAEKKKVMDSQRSGAGNEEVYESHLFYFNDFAFLDGVIILRKTQDNFSLDDTLERAVEAVEAAEVVPLEDVEIVEAVDDGLAFSQPATEPMQIGSGRQSSVRRRGGSTSSSSARSSRYEDAIAAILQSTSSQPERSQSKYERFGNSIASQLEELDSIEAAEAMADLQQVLSRHIIRSIQRKSASNSRSSLSLSSSAEGSGNDLLKNAMINSDLFDEF